MPAVAAAWAAASLLLFGHLLGDGDLVRAQLADGQQLFDDDALGDDGFELVVDDVDGVDLGAGVALDDGVGDVAYLVDIDLEEQRGVVAGDLDGRGAVTDDLVVRGEVVVVVLFGLLVDGLGILLADEVAGLAADGFDVDVLALGAAFVDEPVGSLGDVGVEGSGEALVSGDDDDENVLLFALDQQRMHEIAGLVVVHVAAADERFEHVGEHLRVGPGLHGALLRAAQTGCRDHLHGLGDLPRVLHTADATP